MPGNVLKKPILVGSDPNPDQSQHTVDGGVITTKPQGYPSQSPADFEGAGPLKGWLRKGSLLKGSFDDGGLLWTPVQDVWGNAFLLLVGQGQSTVYDTSNETLQVLAQSRKNGPKLQQAALDMYNKIDAKHMSDQGWFPSARQPDSGDISSDGYWLPQQSGNSIELLQAQSWSEYLSVGNSIKRGMLVRQSDPAENIGVATGDRLMPSVIDDVSRPGWFHVPYIDNVVIRLPVADADAKDFPGFVLARVNRYTRTCVITGLLWGGFGSADAWGAYANDPGRSLLAIGKTLLGVVLVVVGVIVAIYGGAAGVGLIASGISLIVSAWYDFAKQLQQHQDAVNRALGKGATTLTSPLLQKAAGQAQAMKDHGKDQSGIGKYGKWLLPAIGFVLPFLG